VADQFGDDAVRGVRRGFGWGPLLGLLLVLLGIVALVYVVAATLTTIIFFGWLLVIGGGLGMASAIGNRGEEGFWSSLLVAALYLGAGIVTVANPEAAAATLTLVLAVLLFIGGVFRIGLGLSARSPSSGWMVFNGVINIVLSILIVNHWPHSSLYVLGTFLGIMLIIDGLAVLTFGVLGRRLVRRATSYGGRVRPG
jgi:uncharacterized membrane protein HdeD (DUF308 family)